MQETYNLLSHKVEQTHKQVKKLESDLKDLTITVVQHDEKFTSFERDISKKASVHNLNNKDAQILFLNQQQKEILNHNAKQDEKLTSHEISIDRLISTTENLAKSSDRVVRKLDSMTTPKTIGIIMGGVVAFCGFIVGIIKLLNML